MTPGLLSSPVGGAGSSTTSHAQGCPLSLCSLGLDLIETHPAEWVTRTLQVCLPPACLLTSLHGFQAEAAACVGPCPAAQTRVPVGTARQSVNSQQPGVIPLWGPR